MTKNLLLILIIFICNSNIISTVKSRRTALFISFPFIGHVTPLISQAIELEKRDWKTYIVTCSMLKKHVERNNLGFIDIGKCEWMNDLKEVRQKIESSTSFYLRYRTILELVDRSISSYVYCIGKSYSRCKIE